MRGQVLIAPTDKVAILWSADYSRQRPEGYTQGRGRGADAASREPPAPADCVGSRLHPPSFNAFDRLTDVDTALRSFQDLGGSAVNIDWKAGRGVLTSTTGWRFWNWNPSNDRLHRAAGDHAGRSVEAAAVDRGSALRRDALPARQLRRRRLRVPPGSALRSRPSSRSRAWPRRASCWRRPPRRRRRACSMATASIST